MARPRVFVSSTHYDLKHLRSSIENFIEPLGYAPVLSEKDSIAYLADAPLVRHAQVVEDEANAAAILVVVPVNNVMNAAPALATQTALT